MNDSGQVKKARGTRWCITGNWMLMIGILLIIAGLLGARIELLPASIAFMTFGLGLLLVILAVFTIIIGIIISMGTAGDASAARTWGSLAVSLVLLGILLNQRPESGGSAPIHDISTDTVSPPEFVAIVPLRADAPNPPEYAGPETAAQQQKAYPELGTVTLAGDYADVFRAAERAASEMGWEIVAAEEADGRIEAVATTNWFRFKDDVVIRLVDQGNGVAVDVRSKSRLGQGDMGANAARIEAYIAQLQADSG